MNKKCLVDAEQVLKVHKLSVTKPRVAILAFLMDAAKPVSVDTLQAKVKGAANYVTFYRVLKQLVDEGIVQHIDFREGKAYFEYQHEGHHHHHITCVVCSFREETLDCHEDDGYKHVLSHAKKFSNISSHSLEFFGICKQCSK